MSLHLTGNMRRKLVERPVSGYFVIYAEANGNLVERMLKPYKSERLKLRFSHWKILGADPLLSTAEVVDLIGCGGRIEPTTFGL